MPASEWKYLSTPLPEDGNEIDKRLNEWSDLGWILIAVVPTQSGGTHYLRAFFRKLR